MLILILINVQYLQKVVFWRSGTSSTEKFVVFVSNPLKMTASFDKNFC